jgi:hypothetical protein
MRVALALEERDGLQDRLVGLLQQREEIDNLRRYIIGYKSVATTQFEHAGCSRI